MNYNLLFRKNKGSEQGQTLVILLIFIIVAIMILTSSVFMIIVNSRATDKVYQSTTAHDIAESGAEIAMIKLLRNPSYTGETITVGSGQAVVTVSGTSPNIIVTSKGVTGNFTRTVQVVVDLSNNTLTTLSWKEIN